MTPKQEAFARFYIETGNASEAYRRAYDAKNMNENTVKKRASELLQHGDVPGTIQRLQEKLQHKHEITVEKLTDMAMKAYDEAQRRSISSGQMQTSAMVKAAEFIGRLHGLLVDKSEVKHVSGVEDLNDDELANLARSGRGGAAQAAPRSPRSH